MSIVPRNRRIPAGLLGILLGGFGAHKFYLGLNRAGALMVLATVTSWLLHFVFSPLILISQIVALIGFVEGIVYLVRNDRDFFNLYSIRRQEWF